MACAFLGIILLLFQEFVFVTLFAYMPIYGVLTGS